MLTGQRLINSILYSSLFLICLCSLIGCSNNQQVDTASLAAVQIKPTDNTKENDKQFLVRAVEMKYEQILLGKLAQRRSSSDEIKAFAKIVEESSRENKSSLASLGIIKSIAVPSVPTQASHAAYDTLNTASVEEFDIVYIRSAIQSYNDAISHFETANRVNIDPDIKLRAIEMIPAMRVHLARALELDGQMNPISEAIR